MTQIFSEEFLKLDNLGIVDQIKNKGFFKYDNAFSQEFINNVRNDVKTAGLSLNTNNVAGVFFTHGNQFFLTHMLAVSLYFFRYCTNDKIIDCCRNIFGKEFRLKALRYYENFGGGVMQWHTDNRLYESKNSDGTHTVSPGIIFLAYLSDVNDGEFQYISGSHIWSGKNTYHDYSQEFVEKNYSKEVISFKGKAGTILIYNSWGVHRAKPTKNKSFVRKTLFFQVEKDIEHSEPILIKSEFLPDKVGEELKMYLGFGKKADLSVYPKTNIFTMPMNTTVSLIILRWIISRLVLYLPGFIRKFLRKKLDIPTNK